METSASKVDAPAPDAARERGGDQPSPEVDGVTVLVADGVPAGPGQLTRNGFLERLQVVVRREVDAVLLPSGRSTGDCPYLLRYLDRLRQEPVERLVSAMRLWVHPIRDTPDDWLAAVAARARVAAAAWRDGRPDPLVAEVTPTGAADFRESSERPDARAVLDALGDGEPLSSGLRSRAERAFGVDFSRVRIHVDEAAQRIAQDVRARAFAVGEHVGFADGHFRPGTQVGDAVLAHELAHTLQQRGSVIPGSPSVALEQEATQAAVSAGQNLRGQKGGAAVPRGARGLALQSCGTSEGPDELPEAPSMLSSDTSDLDMESDDEASPDKQPAGGQATPDQPVTADDLSGWTWVPDSDANLAVVLVGEVAGSTEKHVFVVPGAGLIRNGTPPPSAKTDTPPPQRPPIGRMPASGHAGVHLIHTGSGLGAMVDVGGQRTGGASVVQVQGIQAVAARFGITSVSDIVASHTHADHVANLTSLVQSNVVRAANVHVAPGSQGSTLGPLGDVITELKRPQHTGAGFGPAWAPSALTMQEVPGVGGRSTMQSRLLLGGAAIESVADTRSLDAYNRALRAGDWKRASKLADAASLMTRVTSVRGGPGLLITGDMRGRDILRVQQSMGEPAFRAFVQQASTLSGLHHLGAVGKTSDVRGLQALLRALGSSGRDVTVVAQTGGKHEVNMDLVRALQKSGIRVVATMEALGRADQQITIGGSGTVRGQGAAEWAADPAAATARARIRTLERAATAIESTSTYRAEESGGRAQAISGLRAEAERLRGVLDTRMELVTNQLTPGTRQPQATVTQRLDANTAALGQASAAERTLGEKEVQRLARSAEAAGRLEAAIRQAERGGYAKHEVRRLVFELDPGTARRILGETVGQAGARHQERAAWREAARRMKRQAQLNRIAGSSGGGARARGPALFGLALEAWNIASPFITNALNESRAQEHQDFYLFWRDISWWQEKGLRPPYRAFMGGQAVPADAIVHGVQRRVWNDMDEQARKRMALTDEAKASKAVEQLLIPPVHEWPTEDQRLFWTDLLLWTSEHVNTFQDYASEFLDHPWSPIRQTPGTEGKFSDQTWQIRVGTLDGDGHVVESWQNSPDLTRVMNATARRVIESTNRQIRERWTDPGRTDDAPGVYAPGSKVPQSASMLPTRIRRFAAGADRHVYEEFRGGQVNRLTSFRWFKDQDPVFLVHGKQKARSGYVWVSGADYNTVAAIRSQETRQLRAEVKIPKEPAPAYGEAFYSGKPEDYMNESELAAWKAVGTSADVIYEKADKAGQYRGTVYVYERAPNDSGQLLVRIDSLATSDTPSSELAWGQK